MTSRVATRQQMVIPTAGPVLKALLALSGGIVLFTFLLLAALTAFGIYHAGKVYPGISVAGVNVSGLSPEEAAAKLAQTLTYPQTGRIVFQGEQVWMAKPADLGLYLDPQMNAWAAYRWGRQGNIFLRPFAQFKAWYLGVDLPPLMVYDQRVTSQYLSSIAAQVNRPTIEASLAVNGTEVTATPGQVGRELDIQATMLPLEARLRILSDGAIPLVIHETPPTILDASAEADTARKILSAPLNLQIPDAQEGDPGPWKLDAQTLAGLLTISRTDSQIQVGLDSGRLQTYLEGLASDLVRQPEDARFIFNDETHQLENIQHATIGRSLNVAASIQEIQSRIAQGEHNVNLVFDLTNPAIGDDATAEKLGITKLVSVQASYFYGSSASRIQNIKAAASRFHGLLVPPGATFSMGEALGDVSLDTGYAEALIIYGNRTIKGVGGGVCQVSTTLFRTAFFGGYPVVERYPHAYRVSYYEYTAGGNVDPDLAGLDATVFTPVVDFRFTNDTPYWLLMETYVNAEARKLTWKFYSTSDGRTVDWETTGLQNTVEPPEPLYQENPDLARGEIRQVDWEAEGADVTVYRTVSRDGQVYFQDQFSTHYLPWRAVFEYGPGTKISDDGE
jgi:vancomycin resistance protein YoaR